MFFSCFFNFIYKRKINKTIPQLLFFKRYLKTNFEVYIRNAKLNMSHDKIVTEWCCYLCRYVLVRIVVDLFAGSFYC